ncbi:MAG: glycine oxidase ThiO [Gemmataceae bacterium]
MSRTADVVIVGGGIIGLTTAYYLSRQGVRVVVLERGEIGSESSWAGAGIISPGNPKRATTPLGQLRARSAVLFPELSAELREKTGVDNGYCRCGGLEVRRTPEQLAKRRLEIDEAEEAGEDIRCEVLDAAAVHRLEPALATDVFGAIYLPDLAQVRNPRHLKALAAACVSQGVHLVPGAPVYDYQRQGGRIVAAQCPGGPVFGAHFLLAGGAWSDELLIPLGLVSGIHPVRGQIVLLAGVGRIVQRIIMAGKEYLVPRPDGRILVGSTEERVGFDKRTTALAVGHLLDFALRLIPALGQAHVEKAWAGLRPGSPDGRPILGQVPGFDNLYVAAGHFRSGVTLSPATAQVMTELLTGQKTSIPLEPFAPDRLIRTAHA